jgi:hypothetical protein
VSWTIAVGDCEQSFAALKLSNLFRKRINGGRDVVTFRRPLSAAPIGQPLMQPFSTVRIYQNGVIWFTGTAIGFSVHGAAVGEVIEFSVCGPWWQLENIVYQQPWNVAADPTDGNSSIAVAMKSHLILGQDVNGERLTIREQLIGILNYAVSSGAPLAFEIDPNSLGDTFPLDECRDLSCAEALGRVLRWAPSVRTWFDYGQSIPVLHFAERSATSHFTVGADWRLQSISVAPRHDMQLRAVAIKYERSHCCGGRVWRTVEVDRYPPEESECQSRVLVLTVELDGSQSQYIKQKITAESVAINSAQWWKRHLPALDGAENLQILSPSRQSELPRELVAGCVSDWMSVDCESDVARATLSYGRGSTKVSSQDVAVHFTATDGQSGTYASLSSFTAEESAPQGLAKAFYDSMSQCPWEGSVRIVGEEIVPVPMGSLLRIAGGLEEWATMDADLQECCESVDDGTVDLRFGPPAHLGLVQLIGLTRANRRRVAPSGAILRISGEGSAGQISQPEHIPAGNSDSGPAHYGSLTIGAADGGGKIVLDSDGLASADLILKPREEYVVENGVLCRRMAIASQPYDIGGED